MTRARRRRLLLLGPAVAIGLAVAFWRFAPYDIAASSAHLPAVRSLLNGYMKNAVRVRAAAITPPAWFDPEDAGLLRLGAAHFASGCAPCHGAPGVARGPVVRGMRPAPTPLAEVDLDAAGFYWVARHGLKYTGMPAWSGAGRDDEPWALAAFLVRYREIDGAGFRRLAFGDAATGAAPAGIGFGALAGTGTDPFGTCARCHGGDGLGRGGTAPKLAGQSEAHLAAALAAYADGRRQSGFMEPVAAALDSATRAALARRFAGLPGAAWRGAPGARDGDVARGRALALTGDEHAEVPPCAACHGAGGRGPRNPAVPRITGQDARWIDLWLRQWRDGPIPVTEGAARMAAAARNLDDRAIADLAAFYAAGAPLAVPEQVQP